MVVDLFDLTRALIMLDAYRKKDDGPMHDSGSASIQPSSSRTSWSLPRLPSDWLA